MVYASPHSQGRITLRRDLIRLANLVDGPWMLMGDFNAVLFNHERSRGRGTSVLRGDNAFRNCINQCQLVDLGFNGAPFTWRRGNLFERLDRALASYDWRVLFPEALISHFNPLKSDHCPILLRLRPDQPMRHSRRPFRFEAAWLTHEDFPNIIQNGWNAKDNWIQRIGHTKKILMDWNKSSFGNVFYAKQRLLRRLNGIARELFLGPNHFFGETLFQKSRCKWLQLGDRNTKFFHGSTIIRRRKSKVERLLNDSDEWTSQKDDSERMVTNFYKNLFSDSGDATPFGISNAFPKLNNDDIALIGAPIRDDEVLAAVKRMSNFKAPGPDGLQAIFYKSQWSIVGPAVCQLIHDIEVNPSKVAEVNDTLIVLIPKEETVTRLKQMRPIGLCNVSYKILTKILAHRLSQVMETLVHPNQCSFIPHRHRRDNIIIFQEVVHSMRRKTGNKGWMAIKIDFEKAYDRLKWSFVKDTLMDIGLPLHFVDIVWACITSPRFRMLWNGEALEEFKPTRGIRQGDPLSPYLFVLCMERLFHLITAAIETHHWKPVKLSRDGPPLSHLAFADDLVLFAEASLDQVEIIQSCLNHFSASSGQKVSMEKTRIFFSKNVPHTTREEISYSFGFQRTDNLGRYLGIPSHHARVRRSDYHEVIERVNKKLSGWKATALSFTGRLTLCKSVIAAIPAYTMQSVYLPKKYMR
uniref:Retrovirus-related Pol polyprotein LINE-1 n=1 Tax=Cajanus cajan TaxID=3821 RepID=A0A151RW19_CAJCA|nr:Retrovirus-related Pol polyprotein LINE-1 [Cajanus cajan]